MTKQTYIYSDANCVLHWMKYFPEWGTDDFDEMVEDAKTTAVKFADQQDARDAIYDKYGHEEPNTIYTIDGYEMKENTCEKGHCLSAYPNPGCATYEHCKAKTATLKRIEPVVDVAKRERLKFKMEHIFKKYQNGDWLMSFDSFCEAILEINTLQENEGWINVNTPPQHGEFVLTYSPERDLIHETYRIVSFGSGHKNGFPPGVTRYKYLNPPKQ